MSGSVSSYPVFGVPASIRVSGEPVDGATMDRIRERWIALEDRFDPTRPSSELSMVVSGRSSVQHASAEFRAAHADAIRWRNDTGGYFKPHSPGGVLELDGLVKAYAIRDAGAQLSTAGYDSWLVELGGDVMSDALGSGAWTTGIPDLADDGKLLGTVPLGGSWTSVATAAAADGEFAQATVLGRDIVCVHALASAVVSGGTAALALAVARWSVDVLTIDRAGALGMTPRIERHVRSGSEANAPAGDAG